MFTDGASEPPSGPRHQEVLTKYLQNEYMSACSWHFISSLYEPCELVRVTIRLLGTMVMVAVTDTDGPWERYLHYLAPSFPPGHEGAQL